MAKSKIKDVYPLTPMQEGILFYSLYDSDSTAYFEQITLSIQGELKRNYLQKALDILIERYDVFRTGFIYETPNQPLQVVLQSRESKLYYEDFTNLSAAEKTERVKVYQETDRKRGFNLAKDCLIRISILWLGETRYELIWSFHHIIMDGWCLGIVNQEFWQIYQSLISNVPIRLEEPKAYGEYIKWLIKQDREKAGQYWKVYLQGIETQTELPHGTLSLNQNYSLQEMYFKLGKPLTKQLETIARQAKVTLNIIFEAIWGLLLQRYNNTDDVVFGLIVSGRSPEIAGVEKMVGLFINAIPVRIGCDPAVRFSELLKSLQEKALLSERYSYLSLAEIQANTELKSALIGHILSFENYPLEGMLKGNQIQLELKLEIEKVEILERTNYNFNIIVFPGEELIIKFSYNRAVYEPAMVESIGNHIREIVRQVTENVDLIIKDLEILTLVEKKHLVHDFNDTAAKYPKKKTIQELFEEQAERTPDNIAVVYEIEKLTYRELNRKANQLAQRLRSKGVSPDNVVGILVERSIEMVIGIIAILKAGGAYLPINTDYPAERVNFMLKDSEATVVITQAQLSNKFQFTGEIIDLTDESLYHGQNDNPKLINKPQDLAYIIYTSGTTGKPKGVMIEHRNVVRLLFNDRIQFNFNERDVWTMFHSYGFDFSVWEMYGALLYGGKLVVVPKITARDPQAFLMLLKREQVTVLNQTPSAFYNLINEEMKTADRELRIRYVIFGGEALKPGMLKNWRQKYSETKLINMYGITETTVHVTYKEITEYEIDLNISNIGVPIPTLTAYIMNQQMRLQPVGVAGELCVGGDGVGRGYLKRPELTAARFVANPYQPDERLYKSGDLAMFLPNGEMVYLGRIDHQVKIRGFRVELGEIENQLIKHEAIKEVLVIAKEDTGGNKYLCAYIVTDRELTIAELWEFLGRNLPDYMIPAYFLRLEKFPLTSNGKIDRRALPEPDGSILTGVEYEAPGDEMEAQLAQVWREVLGVERVGINDDFFELGGDSIKAIQIIARLKKHQLKLKIKDLFIYHTIKEIKHQVHQERGDEIEQGIVTGEVELTPIQEWFFEQKMANPHHFNQAVVLYNRNEFDYSSVKEVFAKILEHHDALRTIYRTGENKVSQYIRGLGEGELFAIEETDLTGEPAFKECIEEEMNKLHQNIDLAKGPLVQLKLFKTGEGGYLGIVIHHLIVDGVSWRILLEDFTMGYGQALRGERIRFQSKSSSFKDWASRLREYATNQELLQEMFYWEKLEKEETLELPMDKIATVNRIKDSESLQIELTEEETGKLFKQVNRAYNTEINDILLTALGLSIKGWTGANKVLLNLEGHGREQILEDTDITRTVGWFTSMYPVILDLKETKDLSHTIKSVKESLRRIPSRGIGYGILKYLTTEEKRPELVFNKKPEISFNYLGEFGQETGQAGDIQIADISSGIAVSPETERSYKLDINGIIIRKKLAINFGYNRHQYRRETIAEVAGQYRRYLVKIIEHSLPKPETELISSNLNPSEQKTIMAAGDLTGQINNYDLKNQLQSYLCKYDAPGMIVGIQPVNEKPRIFVLGKANIHNNIAMNRDTCFKIGSITKTFITTVILQLVEEGLLKLDDPITAYLPETLVFKYPDHNLAGIQIRQLLNHTNGISDFVKNPDFQNVIFTDSSKLWKPEELLVYGMLATPNDFSPNEGYWLYSSTGYILLGIIIENLTKISLKDNIQVRICDKLGLSHTRLIDVTPDLNNLSHCYTYKEKKDMTTFGLFAFWAGGGMISNAEDLLIWLDAYINGKLLKNNQVMFDYIDISDYFPGNNQIKMGLGIFNINGIQGHEGNGLGFQNILYRYRDVDFIIHINQEKMDQNSFNSDTFEIFDEIKNIFV